MAFNDWRLIGEKKAELLNLGAKAGISRGKRKGQGCKPFIAQPSACANCRSVKSKLRKGSCLLPIPCEINQMREVVCSADKVPRVTHFICQGAYPPSPAVSHALLELSACKQTVDTVETVRRAES